MFLLRLLLTTLSRQRTERPQKKNKNLKIRTNLTRNYKECKPERSPSEHAFAEGQRILNLWWQDQVPELRENGKSSRGFALLLFEWCARYRQDAEMAKPSNRERGTSVFKPMVFSLFSKQSFVKKKGFPRVRRHRLNAPLVASCNT